MSPAPFPALFPSRPECAADAGSWCARFYQWTNNDFLARSADTIVSSAMSIVFIVVLAFVARWIAHRLIRQIIDGATSTRVSRLVSRGPAGAGPSSPRNVQRARTVGSVLRSISSAVILVIAAIMILAEFGVNLAPILASAGIVGVAVGFGAQNLVRDFLSGMFMLLEDQYGIGDVVDLGAATGVVETVGLRITTLRDNNGTVWYVRNGEVLRVGNKSQGYAVAVVDLFVAHNADLPAAIALAGSTAAKRLADEDVAADVLEPAQMLGVEKVGVDALTLRLTVRVAPGRQFAVQRALNAAITDAFDDAGVPWPAPLPAATAPDHPAGP